MKRTIVWLLPILISGLILSGCSPKSRYDRMVKRELASGVRYDSLFMGLYFGMPEKDFLYALLGFEQKRNDKAG